MADRPLYPVCRTHLDEMSAELGVWQHASGRAPNVRFGYCTDDVARALKVDLLHARQLGWQAVRPRAWQRLHFLEAAFDPSSGRLHNFRSAEGDWLDEIGSEDAHARALAALGLAVAEVRDEIFRVEAARLFLRALPAANGFTELRPIAASALGCVEATRGLAGGDGRIVKEASESGSKLARRLADAFSGTSSQWPWPSSVLTYENALLPLSLFAGGSSFRDGEMLALAAGVLDWLAELQTTHDGHFSAIGNKGWWPGNGKRAQFDQQPIDAAVMVEAASAAFEATGYERYKDLAESAYAWFLGDNDLGVALAEPEIGACHDGLTPSGPNANLGAESTLSWLVALESVRALRQSRRSSVGRFESRRSQSHASRSTAGRSKPGPQASVAARTAPPEAR